MEFHVKNGYITLGQLLKACDLISSGAEAKSAVKEMKITVNGEPFDEAVMDKILAMLAPAYIRGITYLGGEPFEPENQPGLLALSRRIRAAYPEKSIWSFTGYLFDRDILTRKLGPWEVTQELLSYLDVLVDGPFIASLKNLNLRFRGSSNQRLIDVPASLKTGAVVLWDERQ